MATIRKEMTLRANPARVWDAIRDVGAIHTRLAPDFVTNVTLEGSARIVTFANGNVAKELIVTVDDEVCRLVWAVVGTAMTHHNGSLRIFPEGERSHVVWIADLLPDALAAHVGGMMQHGMDAMKRKLEADASAYAA
jgi:uncharacterized protein YndB with AHSA1/START domain